MDYRKQFDEWLNNQYFDQHTRQELVDLCDEKEIEDRFYTTLEFGTGGLRAMMGAGTNRMNRYIIRMVTKGVADWLGGHGTVAIAYDTRVNSDKFAQEAAAILIQNGIRALLFQEPVPTPVLSFAVRQLHCDAGIVITASHNPKEYNGYKVYNSEGGQLVPEEAEQLERFIHDVGSISSIAYKPYEEFKRDGRAGIIGEEVLDAFTDVVLKQSLRVSQEAKSSLHAIYTPIHGTGKRMVMETLQKDGFSNVELFLPQADNDGGFPTVISPNPEDPEALKQAILYARELGADIVLGTDPDCDRLGVAVLHNGEYKLLTGNQLGAILVDEVFRNKRDMGLRFDDALVIKTIVTSELGAQIALSYGAKVYNTLTGFKYIGQKINELEKTKALRFVIGYEESYGYLVGDHARDKDAVVAAMLICEIAAKHKKEGRTLLDLLGSLYKRQGYFYDAIDTFLFSGKDGRERMQAIMQTLREMGAGILSEEVECRDYIQGLDGLPPSNVLQLYFKDSSWVAVRPSGTEPKLKIYYSIRGSNEQEAHERFQHVQHQLKGYFEK